MPSASVVSVTLRCFAASRAFRSASSPSTCIAIARTSARRLRGPDWPRLSRIRVSTRRRSGEASVAVSSTMIRAFSAEISPALSALNVSGISVTIARAPERNFRPDPGETRLASPTSSPARAAPLMHGQAVEPVPVAARLCEGDGLGGLGGDDRPGQLFERGDPRERLILGLSRRGTAQDCAQPGHLGEEIGSLHRLPDGIDVHETTVDLATDTRIAPTLTREPTPYAPAWILRMIMSIATMLCPPSGMMRSALRFEGST